MLGIEGAHALDGDLANLGRLFDAGIRMIGLTHVVDNEFAGSAHGTKKGGLTGLGRELVREAERRGILIDLAHSSAATIDDVLAMTTKPPVVSHTGVRGTCDNPRNLADDQVRAIARAGGVIGIGLWTTAVCGTTPADVAAAMKHVVALVGDEHVALGSDFDGAVTTGIDASGLPAITQALVDAGFADDSIRRILGANALRVFRAALPDSDRQDGLRESR
jgi:microsomal dipeptidase-like Zn-dependent dipeptidase